MSYDIAVVGLGAMGSAAAYHLAKRGLKVIGFDRFAPGHDQGSSHGRSRVIRQAYYEHPDYVPLVLRSYELWRAIEAESKQPLLVQTGGLMVGYEDGTVIRGCVESARKHRLKYLMVPNDELARRVPGLAFRPNDVGFYEQEAGVLHVEDCVIAMQDLAKKHGADLTFATRMRLEDAPAPKIVVTTGPWMRELVPDLPLRVERQVQFWFDPVDENLRFPLFLWDYEDRPWYGVPAMRGDGVKVAFHHGGETTVPDQLRREVPESEIAEMRARLEKAAPGLNGKLRGASVCMYTNTPDGHFAIGRRGDRYIASACSGHGFKFAPVIGEILADLVTSGRTGHPVGRFDLERFQDRDDAPTVRRIL